MNFQETRNNFRKKQVSAKELTEESLKKAIDGLETIFLLTGHSPILKDLEFNAIEAAKDAGVSYLVKASGSEKGISDRIYESCWRTHGCGCQRETNGAW